MESVRIETCLDETDLEDLHARLRVLHQGCADAEDSLMLLGTRLAALHASLDRAEREIANGILRCQAAVHEMQQGVSALWLKEHKNLLRYLRSTVKKLDNLYGTIEGPTKA